MVASPRLAASIDLLVCAVLSVAAAIAYAALPGGSLLRVALVLPILFFVPGYLVIEAAVGPAATATSRTVRAWIATGTSPAIVGLVALATAVLPGGFRAATIVLTVTLACLGLAGLAAWRRATASPSPLPVAAY